MQAADFPSEIWRPVRGTDWQGKAVLVMGLARSGLAAAELLLRAGAQPLLYDQKPRDSLPPEIDALIGRGCRLCPADASNIDLEGVEALVLSPGVPPDHPLILRTQQLGIPCIGELEFASRFVRGKIYAVTGTNGKTTTVSLLSEILKQSGKLVQLAGNVGFPLSAAVLSAGKEDVFVVEVSSFQLETIDSFSPDIAALLNITPDHINRHGSMARYTALKERTFAFQMESAVAVFNADRDNLRPIAERVKSRIAWFSRLGEVDAGAFVRDGNIIFRWKGVEQLICPARDLRIPGDHNLENALCAVCMAGIAGLPAPVIRHSLRSFAGVEHRIEFVRELDGVRYINDSKGTNPEASMRALSAMTAPTILLAGGFDKQINFEPFAEAIAGSGMIRQTVVFGQTADQIAEALRLQGYEAVKKRDNLFQALDDARSAALPGWNVLLSPACASFDQFDDYEQRGRQFKEHVMGYPAARPSLHEQA